MEKTACEILIGLTMAYICITDWRSYTIYNENLCVLAFLIIVESLLGSADYISRAYGMVFAFSIFAVIFYIKEGMIGAGDVKLAGVLGLWLGWPSAVIAVYLSFMLGGLIAVFCLMLRLKEHHSRLPFAPFMIAASIAVNLCGDELYELWLGIV